MKWLFDYGGMNKIFTRDLWSDLGVIYGIGRCGSGLGMKGDRGTSVEKFDNASAQKEHRSTFILF